MFYSEVEKFKKLANMEELVKCAGDIYNKFLAPNAAFMINASRDEIKQIIAKLNAPDPAMFDYISEALIRGILFTC